MTNNKFWPKKSRTYTKETHLGKMYVIVTYNNETKKIDNLFAFSQGGACFNSEVEALGRALSLMHKYNVPTEAIIKQWKDISCEPHWEKGNQVKSVADGIAQALQEAMDDGVPI